MTSIGIDVFAYSGLTSVTCLGTLVKWDAMVKSDDWVNKVSFAVHCTDGDIQVN